MLLPRTSSSRSTLGNRSLQHLLYLFGIHLLMSGQYSRSRIILLLFYNIPLDTTFFFFFKAHDNVYHAGYLLTRGLHSRPIQKRLGHNNIVQEQRTMKLLSEIDEARYVFRRKIKRMLKRTPL